MTIRHQVYEENSRYKDIFLLGMLITGQHKEEISNALHSASSAPRDCTVLLYTVKGPNVSRCVFRAVCGTGQRSHSSELTTGFL